MLKTYFWKSHKKKSLSPVARIFSENFCCGARQSTLREELKEFFLSKQQKTCDWNEKKCFVPLERIFLAGFKYFLYSRLELPSPSPQSLFALKSMPDISP
jgi:hypothetical protein